MIEKCRLCGSLKLIHFDRMGNNGEYRFYRCQDCALVNYDLSGGLNQEKYNEFVDPRLEKHHWNIPSNLTFRYIKTRFPECGSMLDIGCGTGRLLYLAREAGWRVKGIHLSPSISRGITDITGIEITAADIMQYEPAVGEGYDLVVLRHVLEHLPDSHKAMATICALVRPGGHALLEFPNIDGMDLRYKRFIRRTGLYTKRYQENWVPGHCNEFCHASFLHLIKDYGLQLLHWETYSSHPTPLNAITNAMGFGNKARAILRKA